MKSIIIYATKYGCAEKAAKMLESKIHGEVRLVNVIKERVPALDEYDKVILGGSIYVGKIQKKLSEYILKNMPQLLQKRVGLFICAAQSEPVRTQELETAFPDELYKSAILKEELGYEFDFNKLNFLDKFIVRKVSGITESKFELSNEKIDSFAKRICEN